jgi:hypothetical protein
VQLKVKCKNSFLTRTLNVNLQIDAEVEGYKTIETVERGERLTGKVKRRSFFFQKLGEKYLMEI